MTYKLICFDVDGVIFKDVNFWMMLHKKFGTHEEGIKLTEKYLKTDYDKLVEEVVGKLWKGKDAKAYYNLVNSLEYLPGVEETFNHVKSKGYTTAIVSASSMDVSRRIQRDYGINHIFANEIFVKDGKMSGEFHGLVGEGMHKKAIVIHDLCKKLGISHSQTIYVGDSDFDIEAFQKVGRSIAFNSSSDSLKEVATHVVETHNLSDIIKYIP